MSAPRTFGGVARGAAGLTVAALQVPAARDEPARLITRSWPVSEPVRAGRLVEWFKAMGVSHVVGDRWDTSDVIVELRIAGVSAGCCGTGGSDMDTARRRLIDLWRDHRFAVTEDDRQRILGHEWQRDVADRRRPGRRDRTFMIAVLASLIAAEAAMSADQGAGDQVPLHLKVPAGSGLATVVVDAEPQRSQSVVQRLLQWVQTLGRRQRQQVKHQGLEGVELSFVSHPNLSLGLHLGVDAESGAGGESAPDEARGVQP